jgi:hypothetical protein
MALNWTGAITLIDEQGWKTTLNYDMGSTPGLVIDVEFVDQHTDLAAIAAELAPLTTANIYSFKLSVTDDSLEDATLPVEAEIAEEAYVSVHLAAEPLPEKFGGIRIPAPVDALFLADGETVDTNNADLQAYVAVLPEISDGELIVTARGAGGVDRGYLRFRSRRA